MGTVSHAWMIWMVSCFPINMPEHKLELNHYYSYGHQWIVWDCSAGDGQEVVSAWCPQTEGEIVHHDNHQLLFLKCGHVYRFHPAMWCSVTNFDPEQNARQRERELGRERVKPPWWHDRF